MSYVIADGLHFNKELNQTIPAIMDKYVALITEYFTFIGNKKNIAHKKQYQYILARGLDTITHVFSIILFYTKNLELTYHYSQKSFYYYVEFIEQILDIQHTFLHLSSRDASIFVYKKTIYEIVQEYKREMGDVEIGGDHTHIDAFIGLYKEIPPIYLDKLHPLLMSRSVSIEQIREIYSVIDWSADITKIILSIEENSGTL